MGTALLVAHTTRTTSTAPVRYPQHPHSSSTMSRVFFIQLVAVIVALLFAFAVFAEAQETPPPSASPSALPSPVASASPSRSPKASVAPSSASSLNGFLLEALSFLF